MEWRDAAVFSVLALVLVLRPGGFFGYRDLTPRGRLGGVHANRSLHHDRGISAARMQPSRPICSGTPALRAPRLSQRTGADIIIKYETMHATGSFKERGALKTLLALTDAEKKARRHHHCLRGNHAPGRGLSCRAVNIPATS